MTSPASAQSSLSHWRTERLSMAAQRTGQTSVTGRPHRTMPPGWTPRWRGSLSSFSAMSRTGSGTSSFCPVSPPGRTEVHRSICLAQASCTPAG